jgi:hypothetical protein
MEPFFGTGPALSLTHYTHDLSSEMYLMLRVAALLNAYRCYVLALGDGTIGSHEPPGCPDLALDAHLSHVWG